MAMTQKSVKKLINKYFEIYHQGIIFNLVSKWFEEYKSKNPIEFHKGQGRSWKLMLKYINEDPEAFKQWVKDIDPKTIPRYLDTQLRE